MSWVERGRPGAGFVTRASDLSFAVYLAHPLVLELLLAVGLGNDGQRVPAWLAPGLAVVGTAAGAAVIGFVARESRWSLALTGRPRRPTAATSTRLSSADEAFRRVTEGSQAGSRP